MEEMNDYLWGKKVFFFMQKKLQTPNGHFALWGENFAKNITKIHQRLYKRVILKKINK